MYRNQRRNLFETHLKDLQQLVPNLQDTFVCPICFEIFPSEAAETDLLDIGHVWPNYLRKKGEKAKHQQVLLCKRCNSSAGSAGDEIMQADVKLLEGEKTGNLGLRNIIVTQSLKKPIHLEAYIIQTGEKSSKFGLPKYQKPSQREHFSKQWEKVQQYANDGPINFAVLPPRAKPNKPFGDPSNGSLVQAGFLTSAYLLAFHNYGYTYIFQTCLDPVRQYIKDSFIKRVDARLNYEESKDACVGKGLEPEYFCEEPEISLVIPLDANVPVHQEVRFLYYVIRLPIPQQISKLTRGNLILDLLNIKEVPAEHGLVANSISSNELFASNLDHLILADLQSRSKQLTQPKKANK